MAATEFKCLCSVPIIGSLISKQSEKTTHRREKIFANEETNKGLISKIYSCSSLKKQTKEWMEDLNRYFSKEDIQMAKRHMKRYSLSLIIRKMQIKTIMRYHLTPIRMVITKKPTKNKLGRECGEQRTLSHCWWECKLVHLLWKTGWKFLKKLKIELPWKKKKSVSCSGASQLFVLQSMDCSPPGSSFHGILQAKILEWVVMPFFSQRDNITINLSSK